MGRGIALVLAKEEGCRVYSTARDGEALQALSKEVSETDGEGSVVPFVLNRKDAQAVEALLKALLQKKTGLICWSTVPMRG